MTNSYIAPSSSQIIFRTILSGQNDDVDSDYEIVQKNDRVDNDSWEILDTRKNIEKEKKSYVQDSNDIDTG